MHKHHSHNHNHSTTSNIKIAFLLNFSFAIIEIIGGLFINSIAIISDALHDLGDSFSLGLSWFLDKYSKKDANLKYSYGYKRYSLLAALINSIILIVGSIFILSEAIPRLLNPEPTNPKGMIAFAILGIIINGLAVLRLKKGSSLNEKVVSWHLMEDLLGWIAVLIAGIVMSFTNIYILDPILSTIITLYILFNVIKNLNKTFSLFLQAVPEGYDLREIEKNILSIRNVLNTHHIHIWSLDSEKHVFTAHLVVNDSTSLEDIKKIKKKVKVYLQSLENIEHVTLEIEQENEDCSISDDI
ncbi:cation diffusion facilitator family transporter [Clostridiisalibacter paucivorans]|uniref:cation diffusion facilitator family transporter n=1 Tax=Clostridiisalibacter paucivorans TaxID=408753 RepID=UPI00047C1864|nr:cation diffusion facilitator family transporter [Clostridiisalibacter paucivorans]